MKFKNTEKKNIKAYKILKIGIVLVLGASLRGKELSRALKYFKFSYI